MSAPSSSNVPATSQKIANMNPMSINQANERTVANSKSLLLRIAPEMRARIFHTVTVQPTDPDFFHDLGATKTDPDEFFQVLGHRSCYEGKDGVCNLCMISRPGAVKTTKQNQAYGLLGTCKQMFSEAVRMFYSENEFFLPSHATIYTIHKYEGFLHHITTRTGPYVSSLTITFSNSFECSDLDDICGSILDEFPNLKVLRILIDIAAFNRKHEMEEMDETDETEVFDSPHLAKLAVKAKLIVEVVCTDEEEYEQYPCASYPEPRQPFCASYPEYIAAVRKAVHGVLNPQIQLVLDEEEVQFQGRGVKRRMAKMRRRADRGGESKKVEEDEEGGGVML